LFGPAFIVHTGDKVKFEPPPGIPSRAHEIEMERLAAPACLSRGVAGDSSYLFDQSDRKRRRRQIAFIGGESGCAGVRRSRGLDDGLVYDPRRFAFPTRRQPIAMGSGMFIPPRNRSYWQSFWFANPARRSTRTHRDLTSPGVSVHRTLIWRGKSARLNFDLDVRGPFIARFVEEVPPRGSTAPWKSAGN
jgi:hypothetical protein